jgi:hypothetical protein
MRGAQEYRAIAPVLRPRHCETCAHELKLGLATEGWLAAPDQIMSANSQQPGPSDIGTPAATIPISLRILAIVLRALFIGALIAVTVRVSSPQSETLSSVYETPGDLIRLALGFAVGLWIVIHLFMLPRTAEGYRTWVYLGLVVVPLAWAVAIYIW